MDPQEAVDQPRFCIVSGTSGGAVAIEDGIDEHVLRRLRAMGHDAPRLVSHERSAFGRAQIITRRSEDGVLCGGSDPRGDGCAIGF